MEHLEKEYNQINDYLSKNVSPGFNQFSEITHHIYVTSDLTSDDLDLIKYHKIKKIINLSAKKSNEVMKRYKKYKIEEIIIDTNSTNIIDILQQLYPIIHNCVTNRKKILIHNYNGSEEAAAILIYYLLRRYYLSEFNMSNHRQIKQKINNFHLHKIIEFVKGARPSITLKPKLVQILIYMETTLKESIMKAVSVDTDEESSTSVEESSEYDDIEDVYSTLDEISIPME